MKNLFILLTVSILFLTFSCEIDSTFDEVYDGMEVIIMNPEQLLADSNATAIVSVNFGAEELSPNQTITISTSHGKLFNPPFLPEDSTGRSRVAQTPFSNRAEALLSPCTLDPEDQVFVSATVEGVTRTAETSFLPAPPEDMLLTANAQIITDSIDSIEITANLFRTNGFTSNRIRFEPRVVVESIDSSQMDSLLLSYPDFIFSNNNQAKLPVHILRHVAGSRLRVFLTTQGADGNNLEKSVLLQLQ